MALAEYSDIYWFPSGELARNIPARIFPEHSNVLAALYADETGTTTLTNPLPTDNNGRLRFWVEAGMYWISIDSETFRVGVGTSDVGVTPGQLEDAIEQHNADHTDVHGIAETLDLETRDGAQARVDAHAALTRDVHGIADTGVLETQAGAQQKADTARDQAENAASVDASAKVGQARAELEEAIGQSAQNQANALQAHAAQTQNVHGIPDTATIPTNEQMLQTQAELEAHEAATTNVHGIPDTAAIPTSAQIDAVSDGLAEHVARTMGVHGIEDTSLLLTQRDLDMYATDEELAAHAAQTLDVHGIADTAALVTQEQLDGMATDAEVAVVQGNLDAHAAQTTDVHGIPDTGALLTSADLEGLVPQAQFQAHVNATAQVHGIPDTAILETQPGAQTKADTARDEAIADAVNKYLALTGGHVTGDVRVDGDLLAAGVTDWINTRLYGTLGDDQTDDTAALQAALNSAPLGGVVYAPNGRYRTSSTLFVPPGVTFVMPHSNLMAVPGLTDVPCSIKPLPTFTGDAVIKFLAQDEGGYPAISAEHRLINVMIDGSGYTATPVDAIQSKGNIQNVVMHGVTARYMSGNGIYTDIGTDGIFPYSWRLYRTMMDNNSGHGFAFAVMTDITLFDCQSIGNHANGFQLRNLANSQMSLCRAEWNGNYGYNFTGDWGTAQGTGALVATGCSTDRNGWDGLHIEATGNPPIVFNGLMLRRDGRNNNEGGGGYSALTVVGATTPVVVSGLTVFTGTDDGGTGTPSPEFGVRVLGGSTAVVLDDAVIQAAVTPYEDDGSNTRVQVGPNVVRLTGPTDAPVMQPTHDWNWTGTARSAQISPDANVQETHVVGEPFPRAVLRADGQVVYGPGDAAPNTPGWYREDPSGNLKTDAYVNMNSGGQAGGAFTSWAPDKKSLRAGGLGGGLSIAEGPNGRMGVNTLVGGSVTVANTSVAATSRVFLQRQTPVGALGHLSFTVNPGVGFTITSSSATEASEVAWLLVEVS